jgi:diadenosine tetraphosphate (Ap4A) HIT family hydrolase
MNCSWCKIEEIRFVVYENKRVDRLLAEDEYTYVIVPQESHVMHHLIVVLKGKEGSHKAGLIDCDSTDLINIGKTTVACCEKLKRLPYGYDTIYSGCFSDAGHVHFHLFPLNIDRDKGERGRAINWLSKKEFYSEQNSFEGLSHESKLKRLNEMELIVEELR